MSNGLSFEKHEEPVSFREVANLANRIGTAMTPIVTEAKVTLATVIGSQTLLLAQSHLLALGMAPEATSELLATGFGISITQQWVETQTMAIEAAVKRHLGKTN